MLWNEQLSMKMRICFTLVLTIIFPHSLFSGNTLKHDREYTIIKFNTATGAYDHDKLNQTDFRKYMKLWKTARLQNMILNPRDNASGKSCGTHKYLYSSGMLFSHYLAPYIVFLINPGNRPCDYDEKCTRNLNTEYTMCAHTQNLINFPVIIDPQSDAFADFFPNEEHFNTVMSALKNTILSRREAVDIIHLFFALNDIHKVSIRDFDQLTSPNDSTWKFLIVSIKNGNAIDSEFSHAKITVNRNATINIQTQKVSDAKK
jgi:hypothetical protein